MRRVAAPLSISLLLVLAPGCPPPSLAPEPPEPPTCGRSSCLDAGALPPRDASTDFVPRAPTPACSLPGFGLRGCDSGGAACRAGLTCIRALPIETRAIDAEGVAHELRAEAFPGGLCSVPCRTSEACGPCAVCVPYVAAGRARFRGPLRGEGVCRRRCSASTARCSSGDQCDEETFGCVEGCTDHADCAFVTIDTDGDGVEDTLAHEPGDDVRCVDHTCHIVSPPGAPCLDDDACAAEQRCVRGAGWDPLRAGRCETTHCELCLAGEICAEGSGARGLCSAWCVIGADEPDAIVGIDGHGAGCAPGFRCEEPSSTTPSDGGREGVCRPGTYTDVPTPNLGAACASDDECHSPYGRGMCLRRRDDGPGRCSLVQCIEDAAGIVGFLPDVPVDPARWCDPAAGFSCREGRCVQECVRAEDCPAGLACALWPRASHRICAPECLNEYDCRSTEECNAPDGTRCSVGDRTCTCAPR